MHPQSIRTPRICQQCAAPFEVRPSGIGRGRGKYCSRACSNAAKSVPAAERFWLKVNKHSGKFWNGTECWEWTPTPGTSGYGLFHLAMYGRTVSAHRFAYKLAHGPIPDGLLVCHHCDNPICVRDEHHFLGTYTDNRRDCTSKGRQARGLATRPETRARGERNAGAKLTVAQVRAIRARHAAGERPTALALAFGVSKGQVAKIVRRALWRHIG